MKPVRYHAEAKAEISEAASFYEDRSVGLGKRFLDDLERHILTILSDPYRNRPVLGDARARRLDDFPFVVHYRILRTYIHILAVKHDKRHPDYWKHRA